MTDRKRKIVFVDGHCMVCHWLVQFVSHRDSNDEFRFASLQGEYAKEEKALDNTLRTELNTVVLLDTDGKTYTHTDAVIRIISSLPGIWKTSKILKYIPRLLRDGIYHLIARIRYVFGRKESCSIPTKEVQTHIHKKG